MSQWLTKENEVISLNASSLSSKQISELLPNRTAKAVRHQAEKLGISLTGWVAHSADEIKLAVELRNAGFKREEIKKTTGLSRFAQRYYEGRHSGKSNV